MRLSIRADELNYAVYKYLVENGYQHAAYVFSQEAQLPAELSLGQIPYEPSFPKTKTATTFPANCLVALTHKAMLYLWVEYHTDPNTGELAECDAPFSLFKTHLCKRPAGATSARKAKQRATSASKMSRRRRPSDRIKEEELKWEVDVQADGAVVREREGDVSLTLPPPRADEPVTPKVLQVSPDQKFICIWWCNNSSNCGDLAVYELLNGEMEPLEGYSGHSVDLPADAKQLLGVKAIDWSTDSSQIKVLSTGRRGDVSFILQNRAGQWQLAS